MDYRLSARALPESSLMEVQEIGRKSPIPVLVEIDQLDDQTGQPKGRRHVLVFDNDRNTGQFGLAEFRIVAEPGGAQLGSSDAREAKMGQLSKLALRYLSMSPSRWGDGYGVWITGDLSPADWAEAHASQGASEVDSQYLPALKSSDSGLVADPTVVRELRKLGPSDPKTASTVAALYRYAERSSIAPNTHIAQVLGLSKSTTSHWVKLSRQAGALAPSVRKTRSGSRAQNGDN